ncbi:EAL domain-containing protein [Catenovulum sp. SM1970]|uniref:EAL domain-containing response regulator n=1 Tax=Marinifaba aquimaris TaxID=2741323 RepID=UPI00157492CA|nr:EAL domain-containing protein [Marinifaba aquimaris]NTS75529.1 EAL domain-containing protein [Marinifaba aquimaris]
MVTGQQGFHWLKPLLIDDSESIRSYINSLLHSEFDITLAGQASCAESGLKQLEENNQINLLICDLNLPDMDGVQVLSKLKSLRYNGFVIVVSSVASPVLKSVERLANELNINFLGCIQKPFDASNFYRLFVSANKNKPKQDKAVQLKIYELIRAINESKFDAFAQPLIDLNTNQLYSIKSLVRLKHPSKGLISPDLFIPLAEQNNLIDSVTLSMSQQVLSMADKLAAIKDLKIALNFSPFLCHYPNFLADFFSLVEQSPLNYHNLKVELTENAFRGDHTKQLTFLNRLGVKGVEIGMDDYGKEESTLERLYEFPFSFVKIDKDLFHQAIASEHTLTRLDTFISMAKRESLAVIVEGIENSQQYDLAKHLGCDAAQGFYIAKPMPIENIPVWLKHWQSRIN